MATTLEVLGAILMAMVPVILELCVWTDRAPCNSKRYLWYIPPAVFATASAFVMAAPDVAEAICGLLCLSTVTTLLFCGLKDEEMGFYTMHKTLFMAATVCAVFGTVCWCVGY